MTRSRSLTAALACVAVLAGPLGAATAEGTASPSPSPTGEPSPTAEEPQNQPPTPVDDTATVDAGSSVTVPVLENDDDDGLPEGSTLQVVAVEGGEDRVGYDAATVTFTARSTDTGDFEITYTVSDGELTATALLTVTVRPPEARSVTLDVPDRIVALRGYELTGRARPTAAGRADVQVQRRTPSGWKGVGTDRTDAEGRYAVPFRTDRLGKRVFRAVATWDTPPRAVSDTRTRQVTARADATVSGPLGAGDVPWSWRAGCPVPPKQLRMVRINHLDYRKRIGRGSLVVRAGEAGDIVKVLRAALVERFPIRMIKPADHFYDGGNRTPSQSDLAAMRAGNTSAFNCRPVTGNPYRISQHSYGNAIDINTIENPYVTGSRVYPEGSREYLDRSPYRRGMILPGGVVATRMRHLGWLWGARWSHPDYQHFSSNGG